MNTKSALTLLSALVLFGILGTVLNQDPSEVSFGELEPNVTSICFNDGKVVVNSSLKNLPNAEVEVITTRAQVACLNKINE